MRVPRKLTFTLAALMTVQSLTGLIAPEQYRDVEWIRLGRFLSVKRGLSRSRRRRIKPAERKNQDHRESRVANRCRLTATPIRPRARKPSVAGSVPVRSEFASG